MSSRQLQAAIFDLGGVLTTPVLASIAAFERSLGVPENALIAIFLEHYSSLDEEGDFHLLETGRISEGEYYRRLEAKVRDRTGVDVRFPEEPKAVRRALFSGIARNEPMIEAARRISKRYRTALLTNNVREWGGWRQYYPQDIFELVVDSCEVGMRKPDPAIFRLTCERLGVEPAEAAFVDDVISHVEAARAIGMTAIHFTSTDDALAALRELFPLAFADSA